MRPPVQVAPVVAGPPVAGMGDRLLAVILDSILGAAVFALAGMWTASRWAGVTENGFSLQGTPALIAIGITLLVGFLYYWLGEGIFGATLGKGIVGIAVQSKDGGPCGLAASLVRNLLRLVDGVGVYLVGFLVAVLSTSRQRVGDHVARTIVVRKNPARAIRAVLVALWLAVILVGALGAYAMHSRTPAAARGAHAPPEATAPATPPEATEPATTPAATELAAEPPAATPAVVATQRPLTAGSNLKVAHFAFLESEDGPPRPPASYKRGDSVHFKYDVTGFTTDRGGKIDLLLQAVVLDPNGLAVHPLWEKELSQSVKGNEPVNGSFNAGLPAYAPSGTYKVEIKARDKFKNTQAEYSPTFLVEGPPIAPAVELELRDFGLSLAEDGELIEPPVFESGGTVYMRWKVFGEQARDDKVNLRVGLKVLGPTGKVVLDEPDYVTVDHSYAYHPPSFFVSMSGHVSVPRRFPKGTYTGRYLVTDNISKAQVERTAKLFEVR